MKRQIAIWLLTFHLLSSTELHELLRLPILISHYFEHNSQGLSTTLGEFITLHYGTTEPHDDRDMELPFKQHDSCVTATVVAIAPILHFEDRSGSVEVKHFVLFDQNKPLNFYLADIWQPPRA